MARKSYIKPKLFIVRKYIMACSAAEAIRKDRSTPPDEVWIDDDWKKGGHLADAVGFSLPVQQEEQR